MNPAIQALITGVPSLSSQAVAILSNSTILPGSDKATMTALVVSLDQLTPLVAALQTSLMVLRTQAAAALAVMAPTGV
jgi:hypothetical protein